MSDSQYDESVYPILFATEDFDRAFVYRPSMYTKPGKVSFPHRRGVLYSPNGKDYFECVTHGGRSLSSRERREHSFEFSIPNTVIDHVKVNYTSDGSEIGTETLQVGGKPYFRHGKFEGEANVIPLPQTRHKVYYLTSDDIQIYVDDWDYTDDHESMRLFFNCEQLPILDVTRYRDGGTTFIKTERGTLFVATPFRRGPDRAADWTDKNGVKHPLKIEE